MYKVIERRVIVPNLHEFVVEAPRGGAFGSGWKFRHRPAR